jgi:hypothetical protein
VSMNMTTTQRFCIQQNYNHASANDPRLLF